MKTKNTLFLLMFLTSASLFAAEKVYDWGKTGHRVVGELAERNLTKKALRAVNELLGGEGLAFVSTFADEIRSDGRYKKFDTWHYVNFPFDKNYNDQTPNPDGDIIKGIETCVAILKDPAQPKSEKAFYLKLLIHFVGDLHQPMHIGLAEDKGGNDFQVQWFGRGSNMHRVWDSNLIDDYGMSYLELTENLPKLSKAQKKFISQASLMDWVTETRVLTIKIYESAEKGEKLGYNYAYEHNHLVRQQLQKAGLRLAATLNEIFG
ncbi:MAG: S1/P1 nuclease [Bacteroidetes bacterium]|nr:S1/P1 nuclease [Bacteroidota bacterium]